MIRNDHLEAAVAQGILTREQATRLLDLARGAAPAMATADSKEPAADPDDEKFRLIGGFNDVFVTIGVGLLVAALFALSGVLDFAPGFALIALGAAWGLSEYFSRRMRLALPSIALALMFAGAGGFVGISFGGALLNVAGVSVERVSELWAVLFGAGAMIAAALHERRFHVPIDSAIAAAGAICVAGGILHVVAPEWTTAHMPVLIAIFGLGVFAMAVRVDASDPARRTRRADVAFWLHMLAAPMIVHAIIPLVTDNSSGIDALGALSILIVFAGLGLLAITIDRRALLVSGLTYAGMAIAYFLSQSVAQGLDVSLTLLSLAVLVLGLSAGWRSLRRALVPLLPLGPLRAYIPLPS